MIKEYIKNQVLLPRLNANGVLIIYDPDQLYRDLCLELHTDDIHVVDAGVSGIESREEAIQWLVNLGKSSTGNKGLVVYIPTKSSITDEDKQRDPFALYAACGSIFPEGDSDEYKNICIKAKPDNADAIRKIFETNPSPPFSIIDAVGGGVNWPILQSLLNSTSASEILLQLLAPDEKKKTLLEKSTDWISEAKELCKISLGMEIKTRVAAWASIAEELWRYILFSEFCFDLPVELPSTLASIPRATEGSKILIYELCDRLRSDIRVQTVYIERATQIEKDMELPLNCAHLDNLGEKDTFPFEEDVFLKNATKLLVSGDIDKARAVIAKHSGTVWAGKGESQSKWGLLFASLKLLEFCIGYETELSRHVASMESIIEFYIVHLRDADRRHREFEQALNDFVDAMWLMENLVNLCREKYRKMTGEVHSLFIKHLEKTGWPPVNRLSSTDIFDKMIKPKLEKKGNRVAYFQIDSLRYELGVEIEKQLKEDLTTEISAVAAPLPTITKVGMAGLLPSAGLKMRLMKQDDDYKVFIDDTVVDNVTHRMDLIRRMYGDRFSEMTLSDFIKRKKNIEENIDLLVLRNAEIDSHLTENAETTLRLIHDTLKKIRLAVNNLQKQKFNDIYIATDHGFYLNASSESGDVCAKPAGNWTIIHDRSVLGNGPVNDNSVILPADRAGIKGDFPQYGTPKALVPYKSGLNYFHGGASLQEAIIPFIHIELGPAKQTQEASYSITLSYKEGAKKITTLVPVIDILLTATSLFAHDKELEILLEAHDPAGNVIGELKHGGPVNAATGTVSLKPGIRNQLAMKMIDKYEGKVLIKALNPKTFVVYNTLELETDYMV